MKLDIIDKAETIILNHLNSASSVLVLMGILGTVASSAAQQLSLKKNKELPKDKKAFLIEQEQKDCALSASLTWLISKCMQKGIVKLTNNGYLLNNNIRQITDKIAFDRNITHKELAKQGFFKISTNTEEYVEHSIKALKAKYVNPNIAKKHFRMPYKNAGKKFKIIKTLHPKLVQENIENYPKLKEEFLKCQEGLCVIGAVLAAVITTNLIVPILRNALIKKNYNKEEESTIPAVNLNQVMSDRYMPRTFKVDSTLSNLYTKTGSSNLRI